MTKRNKCVYNQHYQFLAITALLTGSFFQFIAPVLADGTTAGQSISNTATATYEDPNNPGTTINATSNTVTVTVAEVAGITVTAAGVTDATSSPTNTTVQVGDLLIYTYTLTNVGNDPTRFHIPNQATTTGPGIVSGTLPNGGTANNLQYSTDGGTTWINVSPGGVDTPSVPVGGTVLVRVPITVQNGANPNDVITVTLGNTPGDAQNQLRSPDGGDVFTVDNPDGSPSEVAGAPVNGTREASATGQIKVGSTLKTYALATILKIRSGYNNAGTTAITDDKLTYDLSLRVESNDPTGQGITPAALTGTSINVNGVAGNYILVSDAIPTGTDLAVAPTAPPGWQTVYTTSPVTTDANTASWTTTAPSLASVTRVGFINNPSTITSIAPGTTVNGFSIQLAVESTATSPLTVANIAQLFGQTPTNNFPVYDESGDQNPSNYDGPLGNMTPPAGTDTPVAVGQPGDGIPDTLPPTSVDDGFINTPTTPETGVDISNNNSGDGTIGGEANIFTLQTPVASAILNGPQGAPDATGPSGQTNDDFTNKSSLVPTGTAPGTKLDPQSVGFTNTVKNNGTSPGNITIAPIVPPIANPKDLPDGTKVTVTYNSQSAVYTYNQATGTFTTIGTPIVISNVAAGATINYGVEVDLPSNTSLSTDTIPDYTGDQEFGFPVYMVSSIDTNNDNVPDSQNITIDRVYTGFLKLLKVSRVLQGIGPVVQGNDGTFSTTLKKPAPGNIIEYQIQYTNISNAQAGTGNVILNADKLVITEDGTQSPNNWALDNDNNTQIDTSNIVGSAQDSGAATIQFYSGNPASTSGIDQTGTTVNTDVTKYVNTVTGAIAPGIQRTFTFRRKVN
ncbi:hypothetical protein FNW02_15525 [Komarekiella sp. 'clone 1']|uniref:DUF7925 domain-containing protein n=1 Tax=Komarekiella delphini-convector SJRDD-AB1 TaxID=2593771 RepID=A0AA40VRH8_9NOST|nr:hypothetical protein [Komarekiella delphini-convector]MBD6617205.1 hypothetical protein [Komarekiella delphini-convector SJRDD-AB1]